MVKAWNIVRRANSQYTVAEIFIGTWTEAMLYSMEVGFSRHDGEYFVSEVGEPYGWKPQEFDAVQDAFAYL